MRRLILNLRWAHMTKGSFSDITAYFVSGRARERPASSRSLVVTTVTVVVSRQEMLVFQTDRLQILYLYKLILSFGRAREALASSMSPVSRQKYLSFKQSISRNYSRYSLFIHSVVCHFYFLMMLVHATKALSSVLYTWGAGGRGGGKVGIVVWGVGWVCFDCGLFWVLAAP